MHGGTAWQGRLEVDKALFILTASVDFSDDVPELTSTCLSERNDDRLAATIATSKFSGLVEFSVTSVATAPRRAARALDLNERSAEITPRATP